MDSGALITRHHELIGSDRRFPLNRKDGTLGVLKLYAYLDDSDWEINLALDSVGNSVVIAITSNEAPQTTPINPSATHFDGRSFELPRPKGIKSIPERIRFEHPFHPRMTCEIQMYDDAPLP